MNREIGSRILRTNSIVFFCLLLTVCYYLFHESSKITLQVDTLGTRILPASIREGVKIGAVLYASSSVETRVRRRMRIYRTRQFFAFPPFSRPASPTTIKRRVFVAIMEET